ncbi:hypothetical protein ACHAQJ_004831 [Trichoderma viride]
MAASSDSPIANSPKSDQPEAAAAAAAPGVDLAQSNPFHRGEQTAAAMEANLTNLEGKLDALLAAFDHLEEQKGVKATEEGKDDEK